MSAAGGGEFFEQFIEVCYAECDENLLTARRVLLELERLPASDSACVALRQGLLRSLHTLKGLSGMVGVTSAERVAHLLEDSPRGIEGAGTRFDAPLVDALPSGVDLSEHCVAARRAGEAVVDPTTEAATVLTELARLAALGSAAGNETPAALAKPETGPAQRYQFGFAPSAALLQRGINVATTRTRLKELGTVLDGRAPEALTAGR